MLTKVLPDPGAAACDDALATGRLTLDRLGVGDGDVANIHPRLAASESSQREDKDKDKGRLTPQSQAP